MKIGVDVDDVLANFMFPLVDYHNTTYGTNFVRDDFTSFNLRETWGGTPAEAIDKVFRFYDSPEFHHIEVVDGAIEALEILKKNHDLSVVTARPEILRTKTIDWIERHFPNTFSEIHIANKFSKTGPQLTKVEICNQNNIHLLIDDSIENALQCVNAERKILLLDRPWNQHPELPTNITRVFSWDEIIKNIV